MNASNPSEKRWLLVYQRPPYGSTLARDALDVALAAAAFGQSVSVLFLGDGVWQLRAAQRGAAIDHKDFDRQLAALPMYDIDHLYAAADALRERRLTAADLVLPVTALEPDAIGSFIASYDVVLSF